MDKWNEIRTAYKLAKLRTLSATAEDIGVHRSTVMRHIDTLEESLGVKLFQRNDKGYIPTEAGLDIMRLGEVTDNHFSQLPSMLRSKEQTLEGTLVITSVSEIASIIMPSIKDYQTLYPKVHVELIGDIRNFNLEYGEADIAIRGGEKPITPDNIVWPLLQLQLVFCAHKSYVEQFGLPDESELSQHRFIALKERPEHLLWNEWIHNNIPERNIVILGSSQQILTHALTAGCGIGVLPKQTVNERHDLVEISFNKDWQISVWALVHRDMMNTPKIRKFLDILLEKKERPIDLI
ncbi:MAG: LysR family transcriptional regulator [Pseudomonadales bacterium]|nr:LysR family transcriptional regulator [Pseudomonadales bacterium]